MNRVRSLRTVALALIFLFATSLAFAQSDLGSISGFVKDPSGAVVPKAQVTVKNEATGTERATNTNESGFYTVTNIPPGMYSVTAEAAGFKKFEARHNKLDPSATLAVDVSLAVGAATETVEVSACGPGAADGIRHPAGTGHSRADRHARAEWPQPGRSGRVGAWRTRPATPPASASISPRVLPTSTARATPRI